MNAPDPRDAVLAVRASVRDLVTKLRGAAVLAQDYGTTAIVGAPDTIARRFGDLDAALSEIAQAAEALRAEHRALTTALAHDPKNWPTGGVR